MSNSLQLHGLQLCPSLSPRIWSDSCPLTWWCYLTISSSAALFAFCLQSFPASGSFPVSWLFTSGGQSIGVSASASVLPMNTQGWFPLGLSGLIPPLTGLNYMHNIKRYISALHYFCNILKTKAALKFSYIESSCGKKTNTWSWLLTIVITKCWIK